MYVCPEEGDVGRPREGGLPGQALVEDAAERIDVGPPVQGVARDLLGGDVLERADDVAGSGHAAQGGRPLGEAEIGEVAVQIGRASCRERV